MQFEEEKLQVNSSLFIQLIGCCLAERPVRDHRGAFCSIETRFRAIGRAEHLRKLFEMPNQNGGI